GAMMPLITPSAAKAACAAQDGPGFKQGKPKLVYYAPPLSLPNGDPAGPLVQVDQIQPAYSCNATDLSGAGSQPPVDYVPALYNDIHAKVTASMDGSGLVTASAGPVSGGTGPYSYWWSSNTVTLYGPFLNSVGYTALGRYIGQHEVVTLKIRDFQGNWGKPIVVDVGVLPTSQIVGNGPIDFSNLGIGIESTLDTWPTEMQTADDLAAISADNGLFVNFDFRGDSAWDQDFKYAGGLDSLAVDTTDDVWFGGHGSTGGYFQFQDSSHVNGHAVPTDLKLGDGDLEWLQLAACLTLRDTTATNTPNTNGTHSEFAAWKPAFQGLHQVNGFATVSSGGWYAGKIFADDILGVGRTPTSVAQAWQDSALQTEWSGDIVRSIGPVSQTNDTDYYDHIPGRGSFGPDIPNAQIAAFWEVSATA
ncbi:MAG: DUF6345 domain-containing protein, partial [Actinomycetes bacterium]